MLYILLPLRWNVRTQIGFGKIGGLGRGAVGAEDVGLEGDTELLELIAGTFDHGPVGIGTHDNGDFLHDSQHSLKKITGYLCGRSYR